MIVATGLHKVFNAGTASEKIAIAGLDLKVDTGQFVAIIGGNGAGKSTLLNLLGGAFLPDRGRIDIDAVDVTQMREHARAALVARVFQDPMVGTAPTLTVQENMTLALMRSEGRRLRPALTAVRRERFKQALSVLRLGLENRLDARAGELSGGQRQALSLAMATLCPPKLLLLDEHTAALDPRTSEYVMEATVSMVENGKLTTMMVTHNMQHALSYASRIIMMDAGRIVADIGSDEIRGLTVGDLVARFRIKDDRMVLST
ncbi:ATP-binding cassette domain-containing protein [Methylocella sp. CPCC 101449]|uniref:ABC transporter ATP-binding protein n=1 Tax=Methylocella sp. CPCC 101449 TaxID=2987531 RepID=UPI00288E86CC|nr:ATP-binding cassette domain-containing protein [Methylocella sp. CPCC 101449]MDT2019550.1 ATP-binding cassette domain-containing protein [Methylocella sp. CPCC 101449]